MPIPQEPLPDKVIGFMRLSIGYVDRSVIEFLQQSRRLFDSKEINLYIGIHNDQTRSWEIIWHQIWPLIKDNISGVALFPPDLDHWRRFSPTILRDCAILRMIESFCAFLEFPADDSAGASSGQALAKWLHTPRGDGLPKELRCFLNSMAMERIKRAFVNSTNPVNFIIILRNCSSADIVPFEVKNNLTKERLETRRFDGDKWLVVRCPIVRRKKKWNEWEKAALDWEWQRNWNRLSISFNHNSIGTGI